ncbi:DNA polymerase III subunit chi [Palleronia sp. KMU-117]|uniref:DNA polymerase III subunit chi n=1 Tax=Palleronia sp. KMU-117 TaxID=3434108 RepID=UPI003D74E1DC
MGEAYFYHLTRSTLDETLPTLLDRARAAGWRVAVRGTDAARLDRLDERLWLGEGFVPHGRAGGDHDADQPVLLTTAAETPGGPPNGAACLMAIDGAEVAPDEVRRLERVCIIFDGGDDAALTVARRQWKDLTDAGCGAKYWSQETGSWAMKVEKPGA